MKAPTSRPITPPIILSTTFAFESAEEEIRAATEHVTHLYTRWSNPTLDRVEHDLAALEGAERALLTGSGMAAISVALMTAARRPGPFLVQEPVYGGTHELCEKVLAPFGVTIERATIKDLALRAAKLPMGSTIYLEMPANPTNRVVDLPALRHAAPEDTLIIVDATFATPINFQPLAHGADVVLHSATKYLSGHHDVIAGVICGSDPFMGAAWELRKLLGPVLDPAAAYRLWRGLQTLALRVEKQNNNAVQIASRLEAHPAVSAVHHCSLTSHPDHEVATRLMRGMGGVVSFELRGGGADATRLANALTHFERAPSLGGVSSLVTWPAGVSHVGLSAEARARSGVRAGLIRLALGTEDADMLWADLQQALNGLA